MLNRRLPLLRDAGGTAIDGCRRTEGRTIDGTAASSSEWLEEKHGTPPSSMLHVPRVRMPPQTNAKDVPDDALPVPRAVNAVTPAVSPALPRRVDLS